MHVITFFTFLQPYEATQPNIISQSIGQLEELHLQMMRMGGCGNGAVVAGSAKELLKCQFQRGGPCSREASPNLLQIISEHRDSVQRGTYHQEVCLVHLMRRLGLQTLDLAQVER